MEAEVFLRAQELSEANRQLRAANGVLGRVHSRIAFLLSQADRELTADPEQQNRGESLAEPVATKCSAGLQS